MSECEALSSVSGTQGALDGWQQLLLSKMTVEISTGCWDSTEKRHLVQSRARGSGKAPGGAQAHLQRDNRCAQVQEGGENPRKREVQFPIFLFLPKLLTTHNAHFSEC